MKRFVLFTSMLMAMSLTGRAESNYLHIATDKGWEVIDLMNADCMTFQGGIMAVSDMSGNTIASYPQGSLKCMYVDNQMNTDHETGIGEIISDADHPTFRVSDNGRTIELLGRGSFEVYGLDGTRLVEITGVTDGKTVELSGLNAGVYIYRLGGYSVKCSIN